VQQHLVGTKNWGELPSNAPVSTGLQEPETDSATRAQETRIGVSSKQDQTFVFSMRRERK